MIHASEGGTHWYRADGTPCYEVPSAKGNLRPTTLRDARKLNLCPSVTGILKMANQVVLNRWKEEQVLHAALTLPRIFGETEKALLARIWADSRAQAKAAAELGQAIHASVQGYYEGKSPPIEHLRHVEGVAQAVKDWTGEVEWEAERSFAHWMGYGGKCDLSHRLSRLVIDLKTKDADETDMASIKTWDEHAQQLAAYRIGLGLPDARCAIVFCSTKVPGLARLIEIGEPELKKGSSCFIALLQYWQAKHNYCPQIVEKT